MSGWLPRARAQWIGLLLGALLLLICLRSGFASPAQALLSYLFAFLFFTGLSVGSLALLMVPVLTGGAWGDYLQPSLRAAARLLPLQALLVVPILIAVRVLYPWAATGLLAHDPSLRAQTWYLNVPGFVIRSVVYFVLWLSLLAMLERRAGHAARVAALPRIAAIGLIVYALTTLLAATDWAMSLVPHWRSSTFGMMVATGWMLAAGALAVLRVVRTLKPTEAQPPQLLPDLGNLLLMFVLAWSYLAFMQYLTIWIADLPVETAWYIPRTLTSWRWLAWSLIAFHFAVPFTILLSRRAKRRNAWLATVAALLLIANLADALWLVVPSFRPAGFALRWTDLLAPLGMGALWCSAYFGQLWALQAPVITADPRHEQLERAHG